MTDCALTQNRPDPGRSCKIVLTQVDLVIVLTQVDLIIVPTQVDLIRVDPGRVQNGPFFVVDDDRLDDRPDPNLDHTPWTRSMKSTFSAETLDLWMVLVRFGWSRTLQEGQGRSRTKVEKSQKMQNFQKCKRFSTSFRSVKDSLQISIFSGLRNLGLRVQIS